MLFDAGEEVEDYTRERRAVFLEREPPNVLAYLRQHVRVLSMVEIFLVSVS